MDNPLIDADLVRLKRYDKLASNNPMGISESKIKSKYDMNLADYNSMLYGQGFKCAICENKFTSKNKPQVDHCHETGEVRGLLCSKCNRAVYLLRDNPISAYNASKYLGIDSL